MVSVPVFCSVVGTVPKTEKELAKIFATAGPMMSPLDPALIVKGPSGASPTS